MRTRDSACAKQLQFSPFVQLGNRIAHFTDPDFWFESLDLNDGVIAAV
jgi:hypothetical protein